MKEVESMPRNSLNLPSKSRQSRWFREAIPPILLIFFVLLSWQLVAARSGLSAFILPSPTQVVEAAWETRDLLVEAIGTTMLETIIGLIVAILRQSKY
jgi:ABC-type nitrate/sulfonate/bicarbonate transport system permease component